MSPESARLLVVDDEDSFRTGLCERLKRKGLRTLEAATGKEAMALARENLLDVALVDIRMPGMDGIELLTNLKETHPSIEVIILTGVASVETAIEAMKLGAYDYLSKPCRFDELRVLIEKAYEKKKLREQNILLQKTVNRLTTTDEFVGSSERAMQIRRFIQQAAAADCPVLLEGESGVGKELIAREIHRQSLRGEAPFVVLDCGAFPETLLADELMGHDRGAFTTAVDSRQGLLEFANGGTLLMDEIGEMTPANQAALLRIVETKRFRRLGSSKELSVDVRILASTNRNLKQEIAKGKFREDLFFRLEVLHFVVPTLRERKDDIPILAEHFLNSLNKTRAQKKKITTEQKNFLKNHDWPGNIRELANLLERSFFLSSDDEFNLVGFMELDRARTSEPAERVSSAQMTLAEVEREHILRTLAAKKGNKKETARALGISRSRLYSMMNKFDISNSPGE
jgi:DNA-binding NtrC family response regulator